MQINRLSDALGAEIIGIDVTKIDLNTCREIENAFHQNQVLVFRDQKLTPEQHIDFSDLTIWDNRCLIHLACGGVPEGQI